jgi:Ethanolamine ammonia-lyase light chain (EutC)
MPGRGMQCITRWTSSLALHQAVVLKSAAPDRATFLRRPDLGRLLAQESVQRLTAGDWDAVLVVADGLSATAVHRHAAALIDALMPRLEGWRIAPVCVVEQGRVAIGDDIGERMGARLAVVLIGERPGLSSPDSLGAYLSWAPHVGRTRRSRSATDRRQSKNLDSFVLNRRLIRAHQQQLGHAERGVTKHAFQNDVSRVTGASRACGMSLKHVPVIWATQVLESLAKSGIASRSESVVSSGKEDFDAEEAARGCRIWRCKSSAYAHV